LLLTIDSNRPSDQPSVRSGSAGECHVTRSLVGVELCSSTGLTSQMLEPRCSLSCQTPLKRKRYGIIDNATE